MFNDQRATQMLRIGQDADFSDSFCEPLALTSAYSFSSAREAAARFGGTEPGNVYSRFTNPTVNTFEQRVAFLEEAEAAVAFASGMAALSAVVMAFAASGSNIVCARDVFGTTLIMLRQHFARYGIEVRVVGMLDYDAWEKAIDSDTCLVMVETPANPMQHVADIARLSRMAHAHGALLLVDSTMLTPILQRPLRQGADLVLHSAGKYMDGHGRCIAGVVCGADALMQPLRSVLRSQGACLSPMNAWLLLKSLETLELRMQRISANTLSMARWLDKHPKVGSVFYSGLESHPCHEIACAQQAGFGGVVSFEVGMSQKEAWACMDALQLISIATNIGDTRSMVTHPASTTQGRWSPEDRMSCGIGDNLLRLSVGLESLADLQQDIDVALKIALEQKSQSLQGCSLLETLE
ncbi:aminotransferase class I/II-fold pyridoxal phosphate-dependent enzyme [Alcaligenes sp. MMA]|uniref:aminotransferase class I/II-fold pyridoxal phosphate-dependent enzyme n=1 Tax=Alcaligenes sp. MMA TaxID=2893019 RepID=UPI001E5BA530|nr:aminotransferase class I/II-fold pyridoxal phosphate-dependent enzyme [Alcaligenes sp. MMA]MCC9164348.1 aminotransferase class I/II-fold pyridoxal phosphate-dependent enzyme [Alcaligenes sp. MMA]